MEELDQEEFRELLLDDSKADERQQCEDGKIECKLRKDYDYFKEYNEDIFESVMESLRQLKELHKHYDHEFDINELGNELWAYIGKIRSKRLW